jgi:hypothetical protein
MFSLKEFGELLLIILIMILGTYAVEYFFSIIVDEPFTRPRPSGVLSGLVVYWILKRQKAKAK